MSSENTLSNSNDTENSRRSAAAANQNGNVLVIGNSGVGKSTLINSVMGEEVAFTSWGPEGTTRELKLYSSDSLPFGLIDTIGFEPGKEKKAINAVLDWTKSIEKTNGENGNINVIWFCIDGTSGKLFAKTIESFSKAARHWKSVPVIVVITKSYSVPDREKNIDMVHNAFALQTKYAMNVKKVIPVVAMTYSLNETAFAPPEGITDLVDLTNSLMPEGIQAGDRDFRRYTLVRRRTMTQSLIGASVVAAVTVAAVPIPFPDHLILVPIETGEINGIAKIYRINSSGQLSNVINILVEAGAATLAGRAAINAVKSIPGINLGATVVNAIVAGGIVAAIGEASAVIFEKVSTGEHTLEDLEWIRDLIGSSFGNSFTEKLTGVTKQVSESGKKINVKGFISKLLTEVFTGKKDK